MVFVFKYSPWESLNATLESWRSNVVTGQIIKTFYWLKPTSEHTYQVNVPHQALPFSFLKLLSPKNYFFTPSCPGQHTPTVFFTLGHLPSPLGLLHFFTILCLLCPYYLLSIPSLFMLLCILHSEHYVCWLHHIVSPQLILLEFWFLQLPFPSSCFWCQCSGFHTTLGLIYIHINLENVVSLEKPLKPINKFPAIWSKIHHSLPEKNIVKSLKSLATYHTTHRHTPSTIHHHHTHNIHTYNTTSHT